MANSGYKINPYITQVFTTGPDSGSEVSSSYITTFDTGSGFISTSLCLINYFEKLEDQVNCPIPDNCIPPTLNMVENTDCPNSSNFIYNLSFNLNQTSSNVEYIIVEYSGDGFNTSGSTTTYISSGSDPYNINVDASSLNLLNNNAVVYFRSKTNCSSSGNSIYSNIISTNCENLGYIATTFIILNKATTYPSACSGAPSSQNSLCDVYGFCGQGLYIDGNNFQSCNNIYTESSGYFKAPPGWYSDGSRSRYYDGNTFTLNTFC